MKSNAKYEEESVVITKLRVTKAQIVNFTQIVDNFTSIWADTKSIPNFNFIPFSSKSFNSSIKSFICILKMLQKFLICQKVFKLNVNNVNLRKFDHKDGKNFLFLLSVILIILLQRIYCWTFCNFDILLECKCW